MFFILMFFQRQKQEFYEKALRLERQLHEKHAAELEIVHLKGILNVLKLMGDGDLWDKVVERMDGDLWDKVLPCQRARVLN